MTPLLRLAWRESRTIRRRLLLSMSAVALGVAALVAVDSLATNIRTSVRDNSRALLGGDLSLTARAPLTGRARFIVDSLVHAGADSAQITTFPSMASARRTGRTRLVQVRAVSPRYPLVGQVTTEPAEAWRALPAGPHVIVDPVLLADLDARVGDSITLGYARLVITGTVRAAPGATEIMSSFAPRVYIPADALPATQLLTFGSRADYQTLLTLGPHATPPPQPWLGEVRDALDRDHVRIQTATDAESNLMDTIQTLSNFLGLAGLAALLLGGIGVASGISALVARKLDTAAILRCLGATGAQVLGVYLTQAVAVALIGAGVGAAIGVCVQYVLPQTFRALLPGDVAIALVPAAIGTGLALGFWVALLSALRPLLRLRRASPLAALRRDVDPELAAPARSDRARHGIDALIGATLVAVVILRASTWRTGIGTSIGLALVFALLWILAASIVRATARAVRAAWPYPIRQGLANLYRPGNQTRAVILALGFGAFVIGTLYLVQSNLLARFAAVTQASRGNLLFFDVQGDQRAGIDSVILAHAQAIVEETPIVTMRISAIDGVPATRRDSGATAEKAPPRMARGRRPWAVRHEYRSTYRDTLVATERIVAGRWVPPHAGDSIPGVSLEISVAKDLGVGVGSRITWDVQGVPIETRVTSLREVNWARFEPNFFAVFPTGVLNGAPAQFVVLARASPSAVPDLERAVVERDPNVSSIDLSLIRETVDRTVRRATLAIRFLALFALGAGLPVLFSAVASTRRERIREAVLLKTLGATRAQVGRILLIEYAALGLAGSVAGMCLAIGGAWALLHFAFETSFALAVAPVLGVAAIVTALAIVVGALSARDTFAAPPMAMLRDTT
jgi:putative ABC transport system permease protein